MTFFRNSRWRPPPSWIFSLCEFGYSGELTVRYLRSVPSLVQISVTVTEIDALILQTFISWRHGFDFWSRGYFSWPWCIIWCRYLYPVRSYWHLRAPTEKWTKSTFYSATVNEVSNGKMHKSTFWATFYFCDLVHFSFVPLIFPKFKMAPAAILDFQSMWIWQFMQLIVWYLCSVPNLVQISVIVTEIDAHICFRPSFDDVTRINFWFRLLVLWSSPHGRDASSHII